MSQAGRAISRIEEAGGRPTRLAGAQPERKRKLPMSGNGTLEKIRRLAERRQALWSKMSSLTAADRATIVRLTKELEALWEHHRAELTKRRVSPSRRPAKIGTGSPRRSTAA